MHLPAFLARLHAVFKGDIRLNHERDDWVLTDPSGLLDGVLGRAGDVSSM